MGFGGFGFGCSKGRFKRRDHREHTSSKWVPNQKGNKKGTYLMAITSIVNNYLLP